MMVDRYQAVLLFGAPGAGKGTQGSLLGQVPGFCHMSTGDMFRSMDPQSPLGRVVREYSEQGKLVPDEITVDLWRQYTASLTVLNQYRPHAEILILDGIPRTVQQVELMREHIDVRCIVHLFAHDRELMIQRLRSRALKEKRVDDAKEDVVRNRLDVYERETRPVLDCYQEDIVCEVDAIGSHGAVLREILAAVTPVYEHAFGAGVG